jgi:hypothetical protein
VDINNQVFGFYQGSTQYMIQREHDKLTVAARIRWSPLRENLCGYARHGQGWF